MRVIDAIDPEDPAIKLAVQSGVTTSLVLPGSENVMGGEAFVIKLFARSSYNVQERIVPNTPRYLKVIFFFFGFANEDKYTQSYNNNFFKMACGETPMLSYRAKGESPSTRMGVGWKFREQFYAAAKLKQQQEQWDCLNKAGQATSPRPDDITLEPLVGVLKNEVKLNIHCYKVQDFETVIRTSKEFNFSINAFHHASDAYKIIPLLQENNIAVALFADSWAYKLEAYETSVNTHRILTRAGIKVAIKTDHPIYNSYSLMHEASRVIHYGSNEQDVLASVTRVIF